MRFSEMICRPGSFLLSCICRWTPRTRMSRSLIDNGLIYHPDKHQTPQMQDIATQNFQRIREAYEILSDEQVANLRSLWDGGLDISMAMSTEIQAHISKKDTIVLGGNMALHQGLGGGLVTVVLRRQLSPISSVEVLAMVGLRSILSFQTSRQLSAHATGTLALSWSLTDRPLTLANTWSRQLSEDITGNIQLLIGPDTGVVVGWQRHGKKNAGSGELKVGPGNFGASAHYIHHFSSKSQGRITGKVGRNSGCTLY